MLIHLTPDPSPAAALRPGEGSVLADNVQIKRFWFFAGGDFKKGQPNMFTGSFIRIMGEIHGERFRLVDGIYKKTPFLNVLWALHYAQKPIRNPEKDFLVSSSFRQIIEGMDGKNEELVLVSSSFGSVAAAQTAHYLAMETARKGILRHPFHVALGASLVSKESDLFKGLEKFRESGIIGKLIYDELQDEGDNSTGIGGRSRLSAYLNGLGIVFPYFTIKYKGPSFLNTDPINGHFHRRRAQTLQKAEDFVKVMRQFR